MNLADSYGRLESAESFDVVATDKDIHVLAYLALLGQYPVAKSRVASPERIKHIADSREIRIESDLGLAIRITL